MGYTILILQGIFENYKIGVEYNTISSESQNKLSLFYSLLLCHKRCGRNEECLAAWRSNDSDVRRLRFGWSQLFPKLHLLWRGWWRLHHHLWEDNSRLCRRCEFTYILTLRCCSHLDRDLKTFWSFIVFLEQNLYCSSKLLWQMLSLPQPLCIKTICKKHVWSKCEFFYFSLVCICFVSKTAHTQVTPLRLCFFAGRDWGQERRLADPHSFFVSHSGSTETQRQKQGFCAACL